MTLLHAGEQGQQASDDRDHSTAKPSSGIALPVHMVHDTENNYDEPGHAD